MTTHPDGWIPRRLVALFVLALLLMVSCDPSGELLAPEVERVEISMPSGELVVGESMQLQAQAFANGGQPMSSVSFFWESEHDSVVTVNSAGRVTAVGPGTSDVAAAVRGESATVTIEVQPEVQRDPLVIETGSDLPSGTVEEPYEVVLQASGGLPPYEWALQAGSLPAGLSFDGTASTISGTPTSTGSHQVTIQVWDQDGTVESRQFSIQIEAAPEAPTITTSSLPDGTVGESYSAQISASGGETPYSWSLSSGSLPTGLSLNSSTGQISGTPSSAGTRSFTAQVTGEDGLSSTRSLSIQVEEASEAPTITTTSLPDGTVGESYSAQLNASGGEAPYSWSLSSGSLPAGLSLNSSTGQISGTPGSAGTRSFTAQVTGHDGLSSTKSLSVSIEEASEAPTITTRSLPDGTVGESYSAELSASGGATPYSWSLSSGSLPSGLSLNSSTGEISGTPDLAGTRSFTARVTGDDGVSGTRSVSMQIEEASEAPTITTSSSLPTGTEGEPYSVELQASGGQAPYLWSVLADSLPPGLTLGASDGRITGTPSSIGRFEFEVEVSGNDGLSSARTFTLPVESVAAVPDAPHDLWATQYVPPTAELWWDHSGEAVDHFRVERSLDQEDWSEIGTANSNGLRDEGPLTWSTRYYYRVRGCNDMGVCSAYSEPAMEFTLPPAKLTVKTEGQGTVISEPSEPEGIDIKVGEHEASAHFYLENQVRLTAAAAGGWKISSWHFDGSHYCLSGGLNDEETELECETFLDIDDTFFIEFVPIDD